MTGQVKGRDPLLEVRNVCLTYSGSRPGEDTRVLSDFCLSIAPGELVCLLGPSGCGKTTALKTVGSFLRPQSGTVLLQGQPVSRPDPQRVMVFQDQDQLFPWKNVLQNVLFGRRPAQATVAAAQALLDEVGLGEAARRYPHHLSGGMRQRVALCRALLGNPQLLLLDEPFAAVDAPQRRELQQLLLRLLREHPVTALFVTHDIEEALTLGSRVVVMDRQGQILLDTDKTSREVVEDAVDQAFRNR